jgi:guanylate kinase
MSEKNAGRLVILSGPSCIGKSPLARALKRFHPELAEKLRPLVLYNSRAPRPGEQDGVDYHFRTRKEVEELRSDERYVVLDVRGDLQGLDLEDLRATLQAGDAFFEGNPFVGRLLATHESLRGVKRLAVFVSPLSKEEIAFLRDQPHVSLPSIVFDVMRRKLLRRMRRQKGELSLRDLEEVERRAGSAYAELREAHRFEHVIPNHDGEDSENWDAFYYPLGDARRTLLQFAALLRGEKPQAVERWGPGDVPPT